MMPPTTTVSIARGEQLDAYGDPQDINSVPVYTNIPAIISYKTRTTQDPATGTPRQITAYECILDRGTDVRDDDRLTDEQTGIVYNVTGVTLLPSYGVPADVWVALSQVGG
jgi:hypothetical protein